VVTSRVGIASLIQSVFPWPLKSKRKDIMQLFFTAFCFLF